MSTNGTTAVSAQEDLFARLARRPEHIGTLEHPHGSALMTGQCGDSIGMQVRLSGITLQQVMAQPKGCLYTVVCASAVCVLTQGRDLDLALALEPEDVAEALGGLPQDHMHCARLALNALGEALTQAYAKKGR